MPTSGCVWKLTHYLTLDLYRKRRGARLFPGARRNRIAASPSMAPFEGSRAGFGRLCLLGIVMRNKAMLPHAVPHDCGSYYGKET